MFLWVKMFHILFIIAWSVGIFYLPRILVNAVEAQQSEGNQQAYELLLGMANRLFRFSSVMMILALFTGMTLMGFIHGGWLHAKLMLVLLLVCYHCWMYLSVQKMKKNQLSKSSTYYRFVNEVPVLIILGILYLVLFKPF